MRTAKLKAVLLAVALVLPTAACGTSRADTVPSDHTASASCPSVRAAGWQTWANRVHMTVFCPTWLPIYVDGVIGGDLLGVALVDCLAEPAGERLDRRAVAQVLDPLAGSTADALLLLANVRHT